MIFPSKSEFEIMRTKTGIIPVMLTINADELTPIGLFYNLKGKRKFLLESAESGKKWGRYSFLGCDPYMVICSYKSDIRIERDDKVEMVKGRVLDEIKKRMGDYPVLTNVELPPFIGGGVGYVGYDVIRQYEKLPDKNPDMIGTPEACLMFYKEVIAYDHFHHNVSIIHNVMPYDSEEYEDVVKRLNGIKETIMRRDEIHPINNQSHLKSVKANYDRDSYSAMVRKAKEYIVAGDIFQVVLSQRITAETDIDPFDAYRKLRSLNPSPYLFYMDFGDFQIVGSSPESLVSVKDRIVMTNPIAGTRPRGASEEEDQRLKEELLADEKERAEHVMLVDLGRNDIGKVSQFGTVKVERFMDVDMYSHVMHIVSTVSGKLKDDKTCYDALIACLPAGTVSGAPKVRAMEIIDELENVRRGIYAGASGYFAYTGNMDMCIAIRTIIFKDGKAYIQSGAGIVYDSVPETEYQETLNKAMALKEVL
ncbi:anthranilate synthase component 1 [Caldanaerobius fijiensis DSM 17918]|uniref:Anthranilate synthase component 1 n=1 Tax=Caldanaerobius fijiensis DSM 17918 TaxID=1121256 RepID=A0A1M4TAY7_9THEO|nr:anthranilate synthase component 1 [Caldanaerobius fijiensis DSM 17918]